MLAPFKTFTFIPVAFTLYTGAGFFVCLGILKSGNSEYAKVPWPFLSDTGDSPPQSCVFTLVMSTGAVLLLFIVHTYCCFVKIQIGNSKRLKATRYIGALLCFFMIVTGSFQFTKAFIPHWVGAAGVCVFLAAYAVLVSVTSVSCMKKIFYPKWIIALRILITVLSLASIIIYVPLIFYANNLVENMDELKMHSAIWQWIAIYLGLTLVATKSYEFRTIGSLQSKITLFVRSPVPLADTAAQNEAYVGTEIANQERDAAHAVK